MHGIPWAAIYVQESGQTLASAAFMLKECTPMNSADVKAYFQNLQVRLTEALRRTDPGLSLTSDDWQRTGGGGGNSRVFSQGELIEKGGINFSHVFGKSLPNSASRKRPELADRPFEAMGVSVVLHPQNPFVPASHMNVRFFSTREQGNDSTVWWFGGGFDLTPYYPFMEDAISWHQAARNACLPFGPERYLQYKKQCDKYFYLPHRKETRGIGGLFFDDVNEPDFDTTFSMVRSIGDAFFPAWHEIAGKRRHTEYTHHHKQFQQYRRGRYVEFNLLYDRGTLFGLQSGGRTESILMSLPPVVEWHYQWHPAKDSPEEKLYTDFLKPRDWLGLESPISHK